MQALRIGPYHRSLSCNKPGTSPLPLQASRSFTIASGINPRCVPHPSSPFLPRRTYSSPSCSVRPSSLRDRRAMRSAPTPYQSREPAHAQGDDLPAGASLRIRTVMMDWRGDTTTRETKNLLRGLSTKGIQTAVGVGGIGARTRESLNTEKSGEGRERECMINVVYGRRKRGVDGEGRGRVSAAAIQTSLAADPLVLKSI